MPRLEVAGQGMIVTRALKNAVDSLNLEHVSSAAQVTDANRKDALVLLDGDYVILVAPGTAQRWATSAIVRVDGSRLVVGDGEEVGISDWSYSSQAERFRSALRERIQQPPPADAVDSVPPPPLPDVPAPVRMDGLAWFVGALVTIDAGGLIVALLGLAGLGNNKLGTVGIPALVAALLALPLVIGGTKLTASASSRQTALGVAGAVLGGMGVVVILFGLVVAKSLSSCDGPCV